MRYLQRPWLAAAICATLLLPAGSAVAQGAREFADSGHEVASYFEGGGMELKDWADGPVHYIMLPYERDEWRELDSDEHRQQFIVWFWTRRDLDARDDQHEFRTGFYERVAHSNQRFRGFPRGWRSDRGRVWITLGPPSGGMRQIDLQRWGRCSAESGEQWIYYTNNMAFSAQFGEFQIVFVETRLGQYQVCEPSMMGVGGWPLDARRAMEITNEAIIIDTSTEFAPGRAAGRATVEIRETIARTEPLEVPLAEWGDDGIAGAALIPIEIPLRDLLFEPGETTLVARLVVDVQMVAMGTNPGSSVRQEWTVELGMDDVQAISGGALRTAIVLPAAEGGYSVQVRVLEMISGTAWTWEGPVEVRDSGAAVSPPLVATKLVHLREGGEVALLGPATGRLSPGDPFTMVVWVRGFVPATEDVRVTIFDADDNEIVLEGIQAVWGDREVAGPLVIQAEAPPAVPGEYILRVEVGGGQAPVETRVRIQ